MRLGFVNTHQAPPMMNSPAHRAMHMGHSHDTAVAREWDFSKNGGLYTLEQPEEAKAFFERCGFVVMSEVMPEHDNDNVLQGLVDDFHDINPSTSHIKHLSDFPEADLPSSPNHCFRTTCNIVFGRFANMIRGHAGVRAAFATLHDAHPDTLGCSWDTLFVTTEAMKVTDALSTQLHWDHNGFVGGEKHEISDHLCVQGVYYASETTISTPSFACSPGSHLKWREFSDSDLNPSKMGDKLINYLPLTAFGDQWPTTLAEPVRIHAPARSLVLWDSRTCHGNSPPAERSTEPGLGRVSLPISFGPVDQRTVKVQRDSLVKAVGGVRTTHHPAVMLSHDRQGYPKDWTAEAEHEPNHVKHGQGMLRELKIDLNPEVTDLDLQQMIQRASLDADTKHMLTTTLSIENVQKRCYQSYWGISGLVEADCYGPLLEMQTNDLRRLIHPQLSRVQGVHRTEL